MKDLLKLAKQGDDESFFILYNQNQGLVTSLLKKYYCPKNEYEELRSNANFGLIKAIRNYSFDYNVEFSTYAVPTILGEIRKYFKEQSLIKVARSNKERYIKINEANEVLEKKLERSPTLKELSVYLEEDEEDIIDSINANSYISYLDQTYGDDESIAQLDTVADTSFSFTSNFGNSSIEESPKWSKNCSVTPYNIGLPGRSDFPKSLTKFLKTSFLII